MALPHSPDASSGVTCRWRHRWEISTGVRGKWEAQKSLAYRQRPRPLPTLGANPLGFGVRPLRVSPQTLPTRAPSPPFRHEKQIAVRKWCPEGYENAGGCLRAGISAATFADHRCSAGMWHTVAYRRFLAFCCDWRIVCQKRPTLHLRNYIADDSHITFRRKVFAKSGAFW